MSRDLPWEDVQTLLDELDLPHSLDYELQENLRKQGDKDSQFPDFQGSKEPGCGT